MKAHLGPASSHPQCSRGSCQARPLRGSCQWPGPLAAQAVFHRSGSSTGFYFAWGGEQGVLFFHSWLPKFYMFRPQNRSPPEATDSILHSRSKGTTGNVSNLLRGSPPHSLLLCWVTFLSRSFVEKLRSDRHSRDFWDEG